jgi:hypothetical protein
MVVFVCKQRLILSQPGSERRIPRNKIPENRLNNSEILEKEFCIYQSHSMKRINQIVLVD